MKKMEVSCADHAFSQRVGAIMKILPLLSNNSELNPSIEDSRHLYLFIDSLFDSANGNTNKPAPGKDLRSAVTVNSPHCNCITKYELCDKNKKKKFHYL